MIAVNPKSLIESKHSRFFLWISVRCVWKFIKEPKCLFSARTKSVKTAKFSFTSGKQTASRESKAKAFYAKFVSRFSENSLHRFSFSFRDEIESSRECIFTFHLCRQRQHMWVSCCKREGNLKTKFRKLESQKLSFDSLNLSHYLWMAAGWACVCNTRFVVRIFGRCRFTFRKTFRSLVCIRLCLPETSSSAHKIFHSALQHESRASCSWLVALLLAREFSAFAWNDLQLGLSLG